MNSDRGCPAPDALQQLLLGYLVDADATQLEEHLAACPRCSGTLHALEAEDTLVQAFRKGGGAADPEQDIVAELMARLKRMQPAVNRSLAEQFLSLLSPAQTADELGRLGSYRVLEVLGAGGMGIVFKAEDTHLHRLVAIKAMRPNLAALPEARARFLREAGAAAALNHEHIVGIYHIALEHGVPFLVMPLLEGETLEQRLTRESPLPVSEVIRIGRQIAEGLAAAHARGLIHRDIKPANIWLEARGEGRGARGEGREARGETQETRDDGRETKGGTGEIDPSLPTRLLPHDSRRSPIAPVLSSLTPDPSPLAPRPSPRAPRPSSVKILDFGLVREETAATRITLSDHIVGTPAYMAPEQAAGKAVDARSDLFSLGCVLYHLATGSAPFHGADTMAILFALANSEPVPPVKKNPKVPQTLSDLIMRLLRKNPAERPASAAEIAGALRIERRAQRPTPARYKLIATGLLTAATLVLVAGTIILRLRTAQGTLEVQVSEPGATIKVLNEKDQVQISRQGGQGAIAIAVEPGKHRLKVEKDGFRFFTEDFTVESGKKIVLSAKLIPDTPRGNNVSPPTHVEYQLLYAHNGGGDFDIYLMNADGSGQTNLTRHSARDVMPAWSPDGRRIAFASTRDGRLNLYVMNADGSAVRRLTNSPASDHWPSWAPDSKRIAFDRREGNGSAILVLDVDAAPSAQPIMIQEDALDAAWSPDGKQIAFASGRATGKGLRLYVMDHEGGNVRMLSQQDNPRQSTFPAWSADGKKLAYGDHVNGSVEVFILDLAAGHSKQLTHFGDSTPGLTSAAAWSPDGKRLAMVRQLLDKRENTVYVMDADGTNAWPILVEHRNKTDRPVWSPVPRR